MKLSRANASEPRSLQQFVDQVLQVLKGPENPNAALQWAYTRTFIWVPSLDTTVDVDLGTTVKPKGLLVLMAEEEAGDQLISSCRLVWTWQSGYAKISGVDTIDIHAGNESRWKVTLGVIL